MKVRINFTIDVDPEAWSLNYGVPREAMREDAQAYVENLVTEHMRDLGLLSEATNVLRRQRPSSAERRNDLPPEPTVRAGVLDEPGDLAHRAGQSDQLSTETVQQLHGATTNGRR